MTNGFEAPRAHNLPRDRRDEIKRFLMSEAERRQRRVLRGLPTTNLPGRRVLTVATLALVAVVAGVLGLRGSTDVASAAQIREKLAEGLRFDVTISGEFVVRTQDPGPRPPGVRASSNAPLRVPQPTMFVIRPDGSYLSVVSAPNLLPGSRSVAYDASTEVYTSVFPMTAGRPLYVRATSLDPALLAQDLQEAQLGAWVQGALAEGDPDVEETRYDGRRAWSLTMTFTPGEFAFDVYGARVDVVVDQATGLVLRTTQYAYDTERWSAIASVRNFRVGGASNGVPFKVPRPEGATEIVHDFGFQRVTVESAAEILGYEPILPVSTVGRSLEEFAVAKESAFPLSGLPPRQLVASARYGRGADAITVSTYRGAATDLPSVLPGVTSETVRLESGPFAGGQAYVGSSPLGRAGVAAFANGLLLQITAPSMTEALEIANSLRPR